MNKNTKQVKAAARKAGDYFHGTACATSRTVAGKTFKRKPRDFDRKLRARNEKRELDKRITGGRFSDLAIYA